MTTKTVKLKTPAVFKIDYPNLVVKVLNNDTKQYEIYRIFKASNYETMEKAFQDVYEFMCDNVYKWHFNRLDYVTTFFQNVRSYNGYGN